jgi:hypothetical protein
MSELIVKTINSKTGAETERPMNEAELLAWEENKINAEALEQAKTEKAEARSAAEAKLLALGLTTEDLKALLG